MAFIASLVSIAKGIESLRKLGDLFNAAWIKFDIDAIDGEANALKQEGEVINAKLEASTTDVERRSLLRTLNRLRN